MAVVGKVFKIENLSDVDATLLEPASCASHGLDKIDPKMGSSVLIFGSGPTGLVSLQPACSSSALMSFVCRSWPNCSA
jgi:threonine dehydrogenase-like Zn-dependent dehydrogenase